MDGIAFFTHGMSPSLSLSLFPQFRSFSPLCQIQFGGLVTVRYEQGCTNYKLLPLLDSVLLLAGKEGTEHGFAVEFFNTPDLAGVPVRREIQPKSELSWFGEM